jgi:hypothetical protein
MRVTSNAKCSSRRNRDFDDWILNQIIVVANLPLATLDVLVT